MNGAITSLPNGTDGTTTMVNEDGFDASRSAEIVNGRTGADADARLATVMATVVRHLHAAIIETQATENEWRVAIDFLTEVGQACTDWRQEFILLSDVLGVSMLVDAINHERPLGATENTVLGPFHVADAPLMPDGADMCRDGKGETLTIAGRVVDQAGVPITAAMVEVWQADDEGFYDVQRRGEVPDWNLRGRYASGDDGRFSLRTIRPRHYPIPADGPVGRLLRLLGRHPNRAAHLHFIVSAPGFEPAVTHLFDSTCPYLHEDAVFGVKRSLVADFEPIAGEAGEPVAWHVDWTFVLVPTRPPMEAGG